MDGAKRPRARARLEEVREAAARGARGSRQLDLRKERGARRADVGVGRLQRVLRFDDVGPAREQIRRHARADVREGVLAFHQRRALGQIVGQRRADFGHQVVAVLRHRTRVRGEARARARQRVFGLAHVLQRRAAQLHHVHREVVGVVVGGHGVLRDLQRSLVGEQLQIVGGDGRDEADLRAGARGIRGEVLFQRLALQAAQAAEEVDFPRRETHARAARTVCARGAGHVFARDGPRRVDGRPEVGARDAVLRFVLRHVERGHAHIAVVREREFDQLLQARVLEEVAPTEVGTQRCRSGALRRLRLRRRGHGGPRVVDRRRGPLVRRVQ